MLTPFPSFNLFCFPPPAFSPDERYAVYVACDKLHSCGGEGGNGSSGSGTGGPSYFDTKPEAKKTAADGNGNDIKSQKGRKFEHTDDWGERYTDVHATVLCILDCFTGQVHAVPMPDSNAQGLTVGQPSWQPSTDSGSYVLAFTQWADSRSEQDTKLGASADRAACICEAMRVCVCVCVRVHMRVCVGVCVSVHVCVSYEVCPDSSTNPPPPSPPSLSAHRAGMIYCYQRPCCIKTVDITNWLAAKSAAFEASAEAAEQEQKKEGDKQQEQELCPWQMPVVTDITSTCVLLGVYVNRPCGISHVSCMLILSCMFCTALTPSPHPNPLPHIQHPELRPFSPLVPRGEPTGGSQPASSHASVCRAYASSPNVHSWRLVSVV